MRSFDEFFDKFSFFFTSDLSYDGLCLVPKTRTSQEMVKAISELSLLFDEIDVWEKEAIKKTLDGYLKTLAGKQKNTICPLGL